ncbi:hypothetical protein NBC122_01981 [Chryseobacterium salivictor]|uniref:DUF4199 domain-containing protein n=1 Tax=Chryseobacterium salivictor TaxID=2547600 RepID=A0A4P6ZGR2_9FLAO|nr:hypothetical protein NBC122_01981 [Chryseobacterium salivictor]
MNVTSWEILLGIPAIIIFLLIILSPIFVYQILTFSIRNKSLNILTTFIISLVVSIIFTIAVTYYSTEFSNNFLLQKFGFNENGMNEYEYYRNVSSENLAKIKEIRNSQMGIGWPLKAMFACVFFTLPMNAIMSIILALKNRRKKHCL